MSCRIFRFNIKPGIEVDSAWEALTALGVEVLYSEECDEGAFLFGKCNTSIQAKEFKSAFISSIVEASLPEINWEEQWKTHGFDFQDGYVTIDLSKYQPSCDEIIRLQSGPGFGDFSHPTTRLALQMMAPLCLDKFIIDIGSGSGVLAISSIALGGRKALGIDIDKDAIEHAIKNGKLNRKSSKIKFINPSQFKKIDRAEKILIVMNMIRSEQDAAWNSLPQLREIDADWIVTGILKDEGRDYLKDCEKKGWQFIEMKEEEGWVAFHFVSVSHCMDLE